LPEIYCLKFIPEDGGSMAEDTLSDEQLDSIANRLADELIQRRRAQWVDPETHSQHHQWVEGRLQAESERKQLINKIILSACIWTIPLILLWVASSFWHSFLDAIGAGLK
jgi:hypothetical protein